jgi:hypothetical protein
MYTEEPLVPELRSFNVEIPHKTPKRQSPDSGHISAELNQAGGKP